MIILKGRVIKGVSGKYVVEADNQTYDCFARGKLKQRGAIWVGDYVNFEKNGKSYVIEKVLPRKNNLIRPYVSNIDMVIITVAPVPKPDFLLVDKIIINCINCNIKPILCCNKVDIMTEEFKKVLLNDYQDNIEIVICSANKKEGMEELLNFIGNKTVCFAGQSAVGKSSIINELLEDNIQEIGGLSKKTERGKHTTRSTQIFKIKNGGYVVDTCGFTMLETININENDLKTFYSEYIEPSYNCKYRGCTHINEPICGVKELVNQGKLSKNRYDRYVQIFKEIKENRRKKYE